MQGDDVVALDATNGRLFWIYRYYSHQRLAQSSGCKPVVLVLTNGSALAVNWAKEHVNAVLDAWYPGEEGGTAVAE
jgi:Glycosyl hydrolase family 3 C-terminal domain